MKTPTTTNDTTLILPEAIIEAYKEDWNWKGWGYRLLCIERTSSNYNYFSVRNFRGV